MARAATGIASATSKGCGGKAESEAELTVGLMRADAFCGENRSFASDAAHEINGCADRTDLA
jgi:hypothetical protein